MTTDRVTRENPRGVARSRVSGATVLDGVLFAIVTAVMVIETQLLDKADPSPLGFVAIVVAAAPILLRRRAPAYALAAAIVTVLGVLFTADIYNTVAIPAVFCLYEVASRHGRVAALWAAAATVPAVLVILQVTSPHALLSWYTAQEVALATFPLVLGVAAHDRRAYMSALVSRAETAERTREQEALRRVGEERLRIARDVHDVVAHTMVAINVQAGVGAHLIDRDPAQARTTLQDIKRVSGDALAELRSMLEIMRDDDDDAADGETPDPPTQGLAEIDRLRDRLGTAGIRLDIDIDPAVAPLPSAVGAVSYRIVQEALTNVMRHVGPTSARVRVTRHEGDILIEIEDEGSESDALNPLAQTGSGNGLRGMSERTAALGGSFEAGPRTEGGWRVAAVLPAGAR